MQIAPILNSSIFAAFGAKSAKYALNSGNTNKKIHDFACGSRSTIGTRFFHLPTGGGCVSKRLRIIVACACAAITMLVCALYAGHVNDAAERERTQMLQRYGGEVVSLVIANRSIEAGETIAAADVEVRDWISSLAPENSILSLDEVVGKEVSIPIAANAPVCELNFRDLSQVEDIPAGHVAVSVPITEKLGISSAVAVGSRVVAYKVTEESADVLGGSAIVLAVPSASGTSVARGTITIAVASNDVPSILSSSAAGDLRLVVPADDVRDIPKEKERSSDVAAQKDTANKTGGNSDSGEDKPVSADEQRGA